jgi:hypothetical protein
LALVGAAVLDLIPSESQGARTQTISGVFSSVEMSPETGDLNGLEIEFHPDSPEPYALVVFCEGWCNQAYRVPVRVSGNRFGFDFNERLLDSSSAPAAVDHYRVNGRLTGSLLVVDLQLNSYHWRMKLKPQSRFGLEVANPPAEPLQ